MSLGAQGSQRPLIFFLAGILADCELPSVGFGNQNLVLWKSSICSIFDLGSHYVASALLKFAM